MMKTVTMKPFDRAPADWEQIMALPDTPEFVFVRCDKCAELLRTREGKGTYCPDCGFGRRWESLTVCEDQNAARLLWGQMQ